MLQIAYLRHIEEPLALFLRDSLLGCSSAEVAYQKLQHASSEPFLEALLEHIDSPSAEPVDVLAIVDEARLDFVAVAEQMRLAYQILRLLQRFMKSQTYKTSPYEVETGTEEPRLFFMARVVQGKVTKDVQHLTRYVRWVSCQFWAGVRG